MACIVEIRDQELYVTVAKKSRGKVNVSRAFRIYLSKPIFDNHELIITAELIDQVRASFKEHNVKEKRVKIVLNHRIALTKDLDLPKSDRRKLSFIVENEMTSLFKLTTDFIVDYTILKEFEKEGIPYVKAFACALRKDTIQGLENLFGALGKRISSIDVASVSFIDFVRKAEVIDTFEPIIVIDASSAYTRYYLFHEKEFVLMRTLYIGMDDEHEEVSKRVLHVLELMIQSQVSITKKPVETVKVLGDHKRFKSVAALSQTYLSINSIAPNIFDVVTPEDKNLFDFVNALGVLI